MKKAELQTILSSHAEWLRDVTTGSKADLSKANLSGADLGGADLSGAQNLLLAASWLADSFEADSHGIIVYKVFGLHRAPREDWIIKAGVVIREVCHPDPCLDCACGINFGTDRWIKVNAAGKQVWKARIAWIDLADTVVPYNTDGKARCGRMTLLEDATAEFWRQTP